MTARVCLAFLMRHLVVGHSLTEVRGASSRCPGS